MDKASPSVQLFLPVQTRLENRFEHYLGDANAKVVDSLKSFIEKKAETLLFLVGAESLGKTHLLSASVHYFDALNSAESSSDSAAYFSLAELIDIPLEPATLSELSTFFESFDFLALDDLDLWLKSVEAISEDALYIAESFLFGLFNYFKQHDKQLMIASKSVPSRLNIHLKDLQSRLASGLLVSLTKLDDQEKNQLIRALAQLKGFLLDDEVSAFILKRSGRDIPNLLNVLDKLDKASLIEKRRLTVPFVKKTLNW